jgi:hypothetical protein
MKIVIDMNLPPSWAGVLEAGGHQTVHWSGVGSPFLDPSGMLGFLPLTSPERVGFSDGKEALYGRADCVCFEAG